MSFAMKFVCCVGILLVLTAGVQAGSLTLTGIALFGGDSTGLLGTGGWNTACNSPVRQLSIAGYGTCPLSVDISAPGTYTFDYSPSGSLPERYVDLELFFDGETYMPGIHAIIDRDSTSDPPPLSAASTTSQQCLYYNNWDPSCSTAPAGPSSLTYSTGTQTATVLRFTSDYSWNGQIQISVTEGAPGAVPEPGTVSLLAVGFVALVTLFRRQRQHSC